MSQPTNSKGKQKKMLTSASKKLQNDVAAATDHIHNALGRTRSTDKALSSTDGAKATGSGNDPPASAQLPAANPAAVPYVVKINRVSSSTPSVATSGGEDEIPELRSVSESVESGFDRGLLNFGTVNSSDSGGENNAIDAEELAQRFKFLHGFAHHGAAREEKVEIASATPSLTSLANPGPLVNEEGSKTPTEGWSAASTLTAGVLGGNSISQALLYNREPGRIFISFGRSIEIYNEPLHTSTQRYHPRYDPLTDHDPLTLFGASDHAMPGKTATETLVLRDVLIRLQTPHRKWYWDTLEQAVKAIVKIRFIKYNLMAYGDKSKGTVVHYSLNHVNLEPLAHGLDVLSSVDSMRSSVRSEYGREYPEYELAKLLSRPDYGALVQDPAIKDAFIAEHRVEAKDVRSNYYKANKTRGYEGGPATEEPAQGTSANPAHDPNDFEATRVPPSKEVEETASATFAVKPTLSVLPGIGKMLTTWAVPGSKTDVASVVPQTATPRFSQDSTVREVQNAENARKIAADYSINANPPLDPNQNIAASVAKAAPFGVFRTATTTTAPPVTGWTLYQFNKAVNNVAPISGGAHTPVAGAGAVEVTAEIQEETRVESLAETQAEILAEEPKEEEEEEATLGNRRQAQFSRQLLLPLYQPSPSIRTWRRHVARPSQNSEPFRRIGR
ncbi:hypothetical protein B0H16DRAFT_1821411 [Mycena metata]|uniref:Uncharacterized protein n=1 Tax=Mycena metata TaxID=1033252 RepID=A0AAD7H0A4_9AGAR|nr:hypothetical protein B0H16DRAFT_1821411 [Mycena metata]